MPFSSLAVVKLSVLVAYGGACVRLCSKDHIYDLKFRETQRQGPNRAVKGRIWLNYQTGCL